MNWKAVLIFSVLGSLVSCTSYSEHAVQRIEAGKSFAVTGNTKRINTMACQDNDDWYLDGYRVGKSFREHQQKMLSQRTAYCEEQTGKAVPDKFRHSWNSGYQQGLKR
ncbi:hypothetical protein [Pasteurella multocida]|uniref:hypothetical protein n=1 Tax=Pasteurella multocida TaxID=747 RepID=UPI0028E03322|nr:hypothetical protein [Pasteurella multocida]HDR1153941.1 hypothetical protein [Pasteurella multocida]HDR1164653.1 hypothetical protein [Pasteurella multocida]HDR1508648.1 hypothetical protein [Pasteurella multocida]HDR1843995.1 hypothetical protein [Pasteurella multocida]